MRTTGAAARDRKGRMDEDQIRVFLEQKITTALNMENGGLSTARQSALKAYLGEPYGNERQGHSKHVTREVLQTVQWAMPLILRPLTTNEKLVVFQPESKADEEQADLETQVANHYLTKQGNAFMAIFSFVFDCLLYPNAYLKVSFEEEEKVSHREFTDLTLEGLTSLANAPGVEILEASEPEIEAMEVPGPDPSQPPQQREVELYDVKIKRTKKLRRVKIEPCPPEEVLVDIGLRTLNLDDADFVCHRTQLTLSELRKMGIPDSKLDGIPYPNTSGAAEAEWATEKVIRAFYEDTHPSQDQVDDESMRKVWVHECYAYLDVDGDGIAELWRVLMGGYHVLEMEQVDSQPFVASCALPIAHKHAGLSLAKIVEDLQKVKTMLARQLLNNLYRINRNRKYINAAWKLPDGSTQRDLKNPLSEAVYGRGAPSQNILEERTQNALQDILPALSHFDETLTVRTGVNPQINLDPNVLQKATAEAFHQATEQASHRIELMLRIIAETGIKSAMLKVHELLRTHQNKPLELKLKDQWREIDPRDWDDRTEVSVNIGLGSTTKARNVGLLMQLLEVQMKLLPMGLVKPEHIYATTARIIEAGDLGEPTEFFANPQAPGWQQPPPPQPPPTEIASAEALKAQAQKFLADAKATELKAQTEHLQKQGQLQLEQAKNATTARREAQELLLKAQELEGKLAEIDQRYAMIPQEMEAKIAELMASVELKEAQAEALRNPKAPEETEQDG